MHGLILFWFVGASVYPTTLAYSSTVQSGLSPWARFLHRLGRGMKKRNEKPLEFIRSIQIITQIHSSACVCPCVRPCIHAYIDTTCIQAGKKDSEKEWGKGLKQMDKWDREISLASQSVVILRLTILVKLVVRELHTHLACTWLSFAISRNNYI